MKNQRPLSSAITRRDLFRYTGLLGAAAGITATLAACGGGPSSTSVVGGSSSTGDLTTAIGYGNDQSFDPMQTASGFLMAAVNHVYEGLLENDPATGETYAALAKTVPTDATASSWTMQIRDGATWHDGTPVTSDDVVFSFERILDPQQNVLIRAFFSSWLQSVTKVDDQTVTLNFNYPFSAAAQRLSIAKIMPKHVFDGHWD